MKNLVHRTRLILYNTRGETLLEGLLSILVFVVLIASVTMMIMVSLRMTLNATNEGIIRQVEAGAVLSGDGDGISTANLTPLVGAENVPANIGFTEDLNETVTFNLLQPGGMSTPFNVNVDVFSTVRRNAGDDVVIFMAFEPAGP